MSMSNEMAQMVKRLGEARSMVVLTHARPDGDGLGCVAAICRSARAAGKTVTPVILDKVPQRYEFLFEGEAPAGAEQFAALADAAELVLVVDTSVTRQLDGVDQMVLARHGKVVVIDHHATSEVLGDVQWIDSTAAAAGVLAGEAIETLGWPIDARTAEALVIAVTSDSGWLRFSNTDARALRAVARWLEYGVKPDVVYAKLYQCDRPQRLALMTRMLHSLELHCDNRLAVMEIRKADFEATGALSEETENLVNEALRIGSVEAAVLLVENHDMIRVSLRSRQRVNVAAVAAEFGGGGHARAAGLRAAINLDVLKARLTERLKKEF